MNNDIGMGRTISGQRGEGMRCFMTGKVCEYDRNDATTTSNRKIFMISPFGFPFDGLYRKDGLVSKLLKEKGLIKHVERADQALQLGFIMCKRICRKIMESEYILADISLPNANVYYELGLSYSLGKKIIFCVNEKFQNKFRNLFKDVKNKDAFIEYNSIKDLENFQSFETAISKTIQINPEIYKNAIDIGNYLKEPKILIVVNGENSVDGFLEKVLNDAINKGIKLDNWQLETITLEKCTNIENDLLEKIPYSKICIIDTTHYNDNANPYIYFCLGFAHGLQREVIPITNSELTKSVPFDVRGLWQIYFTGVDGLKDEFSGILRQIDNSFKQEKEEYPYRQIWDPFIEGKSQLKIMTCGRDTQIGNATNGLYTNIRTNIDKWDYTTVSELSFFLAQKYPTAKVYIAPPKSKVTGSLPVGERIKIEKDLAESGDCIIVGSASVSDYAEIILARVYGIEPYNTDIKNDKTIDMRFAFFKSNSYDNKPSSFYTGKDESPSIVQWYGKSFGCSEIPQGDILVGTTYGVLTIVDNPFYKYDYIGKERPRKIMLLSGFNGIATYGLMKLVTDTEVDLKKRKKYKEELNKLHKNYINDYKNRNVNILVKICYKVVGSENEKGKPYIWELDQLEYEDKRSFFPI
jgi:hypothetical protein